VALGSPSQIDSVRISAGAADALELALAALRRGDLVAFPTDTVYGVGAHAFLPQAVAHLFQVKDRPGDRAIPLLLSDAAAMRLVCTDIPALAWELADRFWPGALSLVLHRAALVPDEVTGGGPTVAVRVPAHDLVRDLCRAVGAPIAATSANCHGQPAPVTPDEAWEALRGRISVLLDGGPCPGGKASTVLDLTVSPPAVVRAGPVSTEELAAVLRLWRPTRRGQPQ
jgi:L-threonylcarbamoyladenylate synthase